MYKLNKEWFKENTCETIHFGRHSKTSKFFPKIAFSNEETMLSVEKNQVILEELYELGKPYVCLVKEDCKPNEDCGVSKKSNKKIKKSYKNESKENAGKYKKEQVLPKASEEE
jgi:hypothetical protein